MNNVPRNMLTHIISYDVQLNIFYVYCDSIIVNATKFIIYCGKCNQARLNVVYRNKKHENLCKKYGFKREIVHQTEVESDSFEHEIATIQKYHTWVEDPQSSQWACNFSLGGEGLTSERARQIALDGVKNGTNPWAGINGTKQNQKRIEKGIHPFAGEHGSKLASKLNKQRVSENRHVFQGGEVTRKQHANRTPEERSEFARKASNARWEKHRKFKVSE